MTQQQKRIAIFGAGGHGKVVIDAVDRCAELKVAFVFDDDPRPGQTVLGYPVAGGRDALLARRAEIDAVIIAIGNNRIRCEVAQWIVAQGFLPAAVVHPFFDLPVAGSRTHAFRCGGYPGQSEHHRRGTGPLNP